jgi:extradiol dioxygenase family protein
MTALQPFHLAVPVDDLAVARQFYGGLLGCPEGRSCQWVDFDRRHQLVAHLDHGRGQRTPLFNAVDGKDVPVPHFGVVLEWDQA